MRIYVFSSSTRFTGGRQVLYTHANELARRGHDLTLIVTGDARVDWMPLRFPCRRVARRDFRGLTPADLCLLERPNLAPALLRARIGIPVQFCQGYEGNDLTNRIVALRHRRDWPIRLFTMAKLWLRRRAVERAYAAPTAKVTIHPWLVDLFQQRFGQRALLVPNGLPEGAFAPPAGRSWESANVLVVGPSDTQCKRIGDALEAVRLLKQRLPQTKLIRVSSHPKRAMEEAAGVTDEFHTMVPPEQMQLLYHRADVVLMTSDNAEGFGLPLLEGMACGTPIVATDIPAFRGFDAPTDYGHFVPVGRPDLLAAELFAVLSNPAERQRLSRRGVDVASHYTMQQSFDAMSRALAEIHAEHAGQFGATPLVG